MDTDKQKIDRMRNEAIVFLWMNGYSYADIARLFKVTRQWVFFICKKRLDKNKR